MDQNQDSQTALNDLTLDIGGMIDNWPVFITPKYLEQKYGLCRVTVQRRIQDGYFPPLQSKRNSDKAGWPREYFVAYLMEKARLDAKARHAEEEASRQVAYV